WLKATKTLRSLLFFWPPPRAPAEAEESLAALLARGEVVRSRPTAPALEPRPELFRPVKQVSVSLPGTEPESVTPEAAAVAASEPIKPADEAAPSTTSRLLEAKRRAQKRRGPPGPGA